MSLRYFSLVTIFILPTGMSQLSGDPLSCVNEGERIEIPSITVDPCISCFCKNKKVECGKEKCRSMDDCALVITSLGLDCCERCKGCFLNGERYESGETWTSNDDVCEIFRCQEGAVTSSKIQCFVPCTKPIAITNQCCPVCQGCSFEGKSYNNGDTFSVYNDVCVQCSCENKNVYCEKQSCPVLSCPLEQQATQQGTCCPECTVRRRVFDLANRCLFRNSIYYDGESFEEDQCTKCICLDATVICRRENCPILGCEEKDIILEAGKCCPECLDYTCSENSNIYMESETWFKEDDSCVQCTCKRGKITCDHIQCDNIVDCPYDHTLTKGDGECCYRCVENMGVCTVFGDPHYKTYDGRLYNFQGTCKYVLTSDCHDNSFIVRVKNSARNTASFSWTKSVYITIGDYDVTFHQGLNVRYKQHPISLPFEESSVFYIEIRENMVTMTTRLGMVIRWDGDSYLEVVIPISYKNKVCGLCGNYNGNLWDDYTTRGGVVKNHAPLFAETWRIGRRSVCDRPERKRIKGRDEHCEEGSKRKKKAEKKCRILHSRVFDECKKRVDVEQYYNSCVTDMCECTDDRQCQCEATIAYHRACIRIGLDVNWKRRNVCKIDVCPRGAAYDKCAPACQKTCQFRNRLNECREICSPGCTCPEGYVVSANTCIRPEECPT
ncbi:crossveinless 2 precursor [Saccoglossus kowalevskii]|uniref:Crossveinless 2 n=1 Tax=Saccoglossus kowalevskii TaxID=10224 RepID=Q1PHR4_SACKO|nr:crossveinless 2 precursor [Saccoglossus kowalevskii]ABD97265.1 crossveinless 2 [Saccoglossus kowalevskii]